MKKILLLFILLLLTACGEKEKIAKDVSDFSNACTNNNYTPIDVSSEYSNASYVKKATRCLIENDTIEMVVYDEEETAKKAQDRQVSTIKNYKSTGSIINTENGKNYYKYSMISNGYYLVSTRIANTIIFTKQKIDNKETIDKLLKEIDY